MSERIHIKIAWSNYHFEVWLGHKTAKHMDVFCDLVPDSGFVANCTAQHRLHFTRKHKNAAWSYDHLRSTRVVNGAFHDCPEACRNIADRIRSNCPTFME